MATSKKVLLRTARKRQRMYKREKARLAVPLLIRLRNSLKKEAENWRIAVAAVHLATAREKAVIEQIAVLSEPINHLVTRSHELAGEFSEQPPVKPLAPPAKGACRDINAKND